MATDLLTEKYDIILTKVAKEAMVNSQQTGLNKLTFTKAVFGKGQYTPTPETSTIDPGNVLAETNVIASEDRGDNKIRVTAWERSNNAFNVYEIGFYAEVEKDTGNEEILFAIASSGPAGNPLLQKTKTSELCVSFTVLLEDHQADTIIFDNAITALPPATTEKQGVAELITTEEACLAQDGDKILTITALMQSINEDYVKQQGITSEPIEAIKKLIKTTTGTNGTISAVDIQTLTKYPDAPTDLKEKTLYLIETKLIPNAPADAEGHSFVINLNGELKTVGGSISKTTNQNQNANNIKIYENDLPQALENNTLYFHKKQ